MKNSPILIFDEATSSLDSITEYVRAMINKYFYVLHCIKIIFILPQNILQALSRATDGRTSICIAHRLSTVMDADEILVLENGKIGERGTHGELIKKNGLYAKLWDTQNRL